jgi:prophage antirepressor-like protein
MLTGHISDPQKTKKSMSLHELLASAQIPAAPVGLPSLHELIMIERRFIAATVREWIAPGVIVPHRPTG